MVLLSMSGLGPSAKPIPRNLNGPNQPSRSMRETRRPYSEERGLFTTTHRGTLLRSHRQHRIDLRRATRRNRRREERDRAEYDRDADECTWITRLDLVEPT